MTKPSAFLGIDIGSSGLRIVAYRHLNGMLTIEDADFVVYDRPLHRENRQEVIASALATLLAGGRFRSRRAQICLSGETVFSRVVGLPPVSRDPGRIRQIIDYEARQSIPFPLDHVVWDRQVVQRGEDDLDVIFAAVKKDIVDATLSAAAQVGLNVELLDFSSGALYNLARAHGLGNGDCEIMLHMGGEVSTLLILQGDRFLLRTLRFGGATITRAIAKHFGVSEQEAEALKRRHGFVALGGGYDQAGSAVATDISSIVRSVMMRLANDLKRSSATWRCEQGGGAPVALYLSGCASTLPFAEAFFAERLCLEVAYLNPLLHVQVAEGVDRERLQAAAYAYAKVIGLILRTAVACPIEVNLLPSVARTNLVAARRLPYMVAAAAIWGCMLVTAVIAGHRKQSDFHALLESKRSHIVQLASLAKSVDHVQRKAERLSDNLNVVNGVLSRRDGVLAVLTAVERARPRAVRVMRIAPVLGTKKTVALRPSSIFALGTASSKPERYASTDAFRLHAHAVVIPGQSIFSVEQISAFCERSGEGGEGSRSLPPWIPAAYDDTANTVTTDTALLPKVFCNAVKLQPEFSDGEDTKIMAFSVTGERRDTIDFTMIIALTEALRVTW